ncbi:DeoR family transcriptional regulator [Peribacillus loiseleuriae]|uniref:DeoR family transcriptional regulator n=1 Tax=Peribacillus loiseleuriae TaxID=1679170 RepID=UPI003D0463F6
MLPLERKQQILTWLEEEETLRITEISKRLNVSAMTVYRDLKQLIDEQKVIKTSNGVMYTPESDVSSKNCSYCNKHSNTRLSVQLVKVNNRVEHTCCAHCALLRYQDIENKVSQIICYDFLKETTISAKIATFLFNADIQLNHCQPQVLIFESIKQAKQFQLGFGGDIYQFKDAIEKVNQVMEGKSCHTSII